METLLKVARMDLVPREGVAGTLEEGGERRFVVEGVSKSATWYSPLNGDDMMDALLWFQADKYNFSFVARCLIMSSPIFSPLFTGSIDQSQYARLALR